MGQYHYVINIDRHEYLDPYALGDGMKLMEQAMSIGGTMTGLCLLLAASNGRGGGDLRLPEGHPHAALVGSWAGNRIAIVGDYAEDADLPLDYHASTIWDDCRLGRDGWRDVSEGVRALIEADGEMTYTRDGDLWARESRYGGTIRQMRPDYVLYGRTPAIDELLGREP